jgi:hypothetical protein
MILKAIEKQVGGTAAASATASSRLGKSMMLVVESFAEEMSIAFDGVPEKFQAIMPKLTEIGGKAGRAMADALTDSMAGDHEKMVAIGDLIGSTIGAAAMAALTKITSDAQLSVGNIFTQRKNWLTGEVNQDDLKKQESQKLDFAELLDSMLTNYQVREKAAAVMGTGPEAYYPGMRSSVSEAELNRRHGGEVPGTGGKYVYTYDPSIFKDINGHLIKLNEKFQKVADNTKEGSKL